ncbi:MAG: ATP-binding protein [Proteobacteria bacterium]|nr:ATP-binding protein [Pseudomonadota bacterium]
MKLVSVISRYFGSTMFSAIAGVVGVIALLVLSLINDFQDAKLHAQIEAENVSRLLDEHALAIVQKVDLALRDVQRYVRPDDMRLARGAGGSRAAELHALLKSHVDSVPEVSLLHLINAHGEHIHSSLAALPNVNLADRQYFLSQRDDPAAGLMISVPLVSRVTNNWTLILSRRINFEDGSFAGTVQASLDMRYFQQFYRSLDLGTGGLVALYDKELHLASRYPSSEKDMGKVFDLHAKPYIEKGMKYATYHGKSPLDGIERLYSFRQVGDLPLIVIAGIAEADYLAESYRHVWQYGVGAAIFVFVVIGFGLRQRRAEEAVRQLNAELEQRVAQRTAQLEAANKELEEFSYSMSHDMRTPLRALDGFSKILQEEHGAGIDDEGKRLLKALRDNAQRMGRMIDDILRFWGIGRRRMEYSSVAIADLASEIFTELQAATPTRPMRLEIGALPPAWGDRDLLGQVVRELLSNAVKYSPTDGEALIVIGGVVEEESSVYSVTDHGVGFDMRYADKLFRVFERVHQTGQYEGSGIGLAIVKRIVERHRGRVWAEGRVGEGATFHFALPLRKTGESLRLE